MAAGVKLGYIQFKLCNVSFPQLQYFTTYIMLIVLF